MSELASPIHVPHGACACDVTTPERAGSCGCKTLDLGRETLTDMMVAKMRGDTAEFERLKRDGLAKLNASSAQRRAAVNHDDHDDHHDDHDDHPEINEFSKDTDMQRHDDIDTDHMDAERSDSYLDAHDSMVQANRFAWCKTPQARADAIAIARVDQEHADSARHDRRADGTRIDQAPATSSRSAKASVDDEYGKMVARNRAAGNLGGQ